MRQVLADNHPSLAWAKASKLPTRGVDGSDSLVTARTTQESPDPSVCRLTGRSKKRPGEFSELLVHNNDSGGKPNLRQGPTVLSWIGSRIEVSQLS